METNKYGCLNFLDLKLSIINNLIEIRLIENRQLETHHDTPKKAGFIRLIDRTLKLPLTPNLKKKNLVFKNNRYQEIFIDRL